VTSPSRVAMPVLCALLEIGSTAALGQDGKPAPVAQQVTPELVRSKEAMVRRLLTDSPVAQRIALSGNPDAKALFSRAQEQYGAAAAAFKTGDLARANEAYNDALWTVGKARQLVPDDESQKVELKVRYGRLLESTDTLKASYARHAKGAKDGAAQRELAQIEAAIAEGKAFANTEQLHDAIRVLERAEQMLMAGINRLIGSATLDYAVKFETPAQEFAHELDRNKSFADLVPVALNELRPGEEARRLVERYVAQNVAMREQAQAQAQAADYASALKTIRNGSGYLQRALQAAGLVVPQQDPRQE